MCSMEVVDTADLPATLREAAAQGTAVLPDMPLREALAALEKQMIIRALQQSGGNRAEAARILGIARPQLYTKMEEHEVGDAKRASPLGPTGAPPRR
jgi:DNA-binding NtrC family response regulator